MTWRTKCEVEQWGDGFGSVTVFFGEAEGVYLELGTRVAREMGLIGGYFATIHPDTLADLRRMG